MRLWRQPHRYPKRPLWEQRCTHGAKFCWSWTHSLQLIWRFATANNLHAVKPVAGKTADQTGESRYPDNKYTLPVEVSGWSWGTRHLQTVSRWRHAGILRNSLEVWGIPMCRWWKAEPTKKRIENLQEKYYRIILFAKGGAAVRRLGGGGRGPFKSILSMHRP